VRHDLNCGQRNKDELVLTHDVKFRILAETRVQLRVQSAHARDRRGDKGRTERTRRRQNTRVRGTDKVGTGGDDDASASHRLQCEGDASFFLFSLHERVRDWKE